MPGSGRVAGPSPDLATLLGRHPPFDALPPAALRAVADASRVEVYEPGAVVLDAFAAPPGELYLVLDGRVALWDADDTDPAADEVLGPGGVFGLSAMLTERPIGPRAVVLERATVASVPSGALEPVFASPQGARFLSDWLSEVAYGGASGDGGPTYRTVDELVHGEPLVVAPTASVAEVARAMTESGVRSAVVEMGAGRYGLVTDSLLRRRVLAGEVPTTAEIRQVMDPSPATATAGQSASEALILMLDRDADHLLVTDGSGALRGVLAPRDFTVSTTTHGVSLHEQLGRAATTDELVERVARVPATLEDLLRRGLAPAKVISVYSSILDAMVRRAIRLVFDAHPDLSLDAFTWLALGSNGRREAVLCSDVDSAVAFADDVPPEAIPSYRAAFAQVDALMARAGVSHDTQGATAAHTLFARTNADWRAAALEWLAAPEAHNGAMMTSLLVDGRPIHGDPQLPAVSAVFTDLRRHPSAMRLLLRESLAHRARMRTVRDVVGRRLGQFDVKSHALLPVANLARWAALSVGSPALPTVERLRAAAGSAMLPSDRAETLVEVFGLLQGLRLRYQLVQSAAGEQPSDVLELDHLSPLDRSLVTEAVREISAIQRRMTNLANYLPPEAWTAYDGG